MGETHRAKFIGLSIKKIVVIGPESTGKSTLSKALAKELKTVWVPEYAREYLTSICRNYQAEDILAIAKGQLQAEDFLIQRAHQFLICDTDLYVHKVWSEHSYGCCDKWILEQIAVRKYDLYLLTNIDMPWEDDPLREHGSESWRNYFYNQYKDIVVNSGIRWVAVNGDHEQRLQTAMNAIEPLRN